MVPKPDRMTAMQQLIDEVKATLPIYAPETFVCGPQGSCLGCPKKLFEMVESELCYWESALRRGVIPQFDEIRRFGKLCLSVRRALLRNQIPLLQKKKP